MHLTFISYKYILRIENKSRKCDLRQKYRYKKGYGTGLRQPKYAEHSPYTLQTSFKYQTELKVKSIKGRKKNEKKITKAQINKVRRRRPGRNK